MNATHPSFCRLLFQRVLTPMAAVGPLLIGGCDTFEAPAADAGTPRLASGTTSAKAKEAADVSGHAAAVRDAGADAGGGGGGSGGAGAAGSRNVDTKPDASRAADSGKDDPESADAGTDEPCQVAGAEKPTILLVIDGSGSMLNPLGDKTRWTALRGALLDPDHGPIKRFEHDLQWGLSIYDGSLGESPPQGVLPDGGVIHFEPTDMCPRIVTVPGKVDNYAAISAAFTQQPLGGSTPTHKVLSALLAQLPTSPAALRRTSIVLATDGEPNDFCETDANTVFPAPVDVAPLVIDAVTQAAARGVKTYVINLAADDQQLIQHLEQVAKAGDTGQSAFAPSDQTALSEALAHIVSAAPSCMP